MLEHFRPDLIVPRLELLDQDELARRGIRGIILDLDNTVCAWRSREPGPECRAWIQRAKQRFALCLLSNTIRSRRLKVVGEKLGVPALARCGLGRKPYPEGYRCAMRLLGTTPEQTAMVGDQLMTDIRGANRLGLTTVWSLPLSAHEFCWTKLMRRLERRIVRRLGIDLSPYQATTPPEGAQT